MDGYEVVKAVARDEPELIPVIRACFEYGVEPFKKKWVWPRVSNPWTLAPLVEKGVLVKISAGGADRNAAYGFADRDGAGRALVELLEAA